MKTAVMTDTNSGITMEEGEKHGVYVLPMPVIIDGKDFMEELTLKHEQLYKALNENKDIVFLNLIEKWDGKAPNTISIGGSGGGLFVPAK